MKKKRSSSKRKKISVVETPELVANLRKILMEFNDDYHRGILQRIQGVHYNLTHLQARNHRDCFHKLMYEKNRTVQNPEDTYTRKIDAAMEEILSFLSSSEECQFTLTELVDAIKNCDVIPSEQTIQDRLKAIFSDRIIISSKVGGVTYVCFTDNLYDILTDSWRNKSKPNTIEEEENHLIDCS